MVCATLIAGGTASAVAPMDVGVGGAFASAGQRLEAASGVSSLSLETQLLARDQQRLLDAIESHQDAFGGEDAAAALDAALAAQATSLGVQVVPGPVESSPSLVVAAQRLAALHGSPLDLETATALSEIPSESAQQLTAVLDAFRGLTVATREAYGAVDRNALTTEGPLASGLDVLSILGERLSLTESVRGLVQPQSASHAPPIQQPPVFSIAVGCDDDTYTVDFALLVDMCGDDTYLNNAGGSSLDGGACTGDIVAAAAIDLSGDDSYTSGRSCGANGGGFGGVGVLIDVGGEDNYDANRQGVNGGANLGGIGLLVDVASSFRHEVKFRAGINGGGPFVEAEQTLEIRDADDRYNATTVGVNGGSSLGIGLLVDVGGSDLYQALGSGTNGGGTTAGLGFLVDAGEGADQYLATGGAVNGGGILGVGALVDGGGSDLYAASDFAATNGGAVSGRGLLVDLGGNDLYQADATGVNGGGFFGGVGTLLDLAGNDTYTAGGVGSNGGAFLAAVGVLVDAGGNDSYTASGSATNGGAGSQAVALLLDLGAGTDTYADSNPAASGTNKTLVPKGLLGAQIDT